MEVPVVMSYKVLLHCSVSMQSSVWVLEDEAIAQSTEWLLQTMKKKKQAQNLSISGYLLIEE
jgi:hypothetical protein